MGRGSMERKGGRGKKVNEKGTRGMEKEIGREGKELMVKVQDVSEGNKKVI